MRPTKHINRDNFLGSLVSVRMALNQGIDDTQELRRLLDEALHVIHRQQESRRIARTRAEEAMHAADTLIMPNYDVG